MSNEETDDQEDTGGVEIRPIRRKAKKKNDDDTQAVIENDEAIPLFPNIDKDARNVITAIRVWKRSLPGEGYKGDISPTSTLDFIAKRFGNGLYDLEALNQAQQVLRRTQNIKIDIGMPDGLLPKQPAVSDSAPMAERLLDRQAQQFASDSQRNKEISDRAIETTKQLSSDYATMIREDTKSRTERDREYFAAQTQQMTQMMQALLLQTTQMHVQQMAAAREGFQQTMQMMQAQNAHAQAMNNPVLLLSLFKEGLALGQSTGESEDVVSTVLKSGVMGLGHIKDMMGLQALPQPPRLPGGNGAKLPAPKGKAGGKKGIPLSNEELRDLVRLKRLAQSTGQDFHGMIRQAQAVLGAEGHEDPEDESDEESDEDHSDDKSENRSPKVEGGKPPH
jgi:hypothetical protein